MSDTAAANHFHAVSADLVHKTAAAEALVDAVAAVPNGWILRSRLPDHHDFHNDSTGRQADFHDPLFVLEAFRQGCIAASHVFYNVPLSFRYTVRFYELTVLDFAALELGSGPAEFDFHTEIRSEFRPDPHGAVHGLTVAATARRHGVPAMAVGGSFGWLPDAQWQRVRVGASWEAGPQPPPIDPVAVGRTKPSHVVIGDPVQSHDDGSACAPIVVDTKDGTFFDHPLDHLPGGLIMEACRQLAVSVMGRGGAVIGPSTLRCDFESFAELHLPCVVGLAPTGPGLTFTAQLAQSGHTRARVELAFVEQVSP